MKSTVGMGNLLWAGIGDTIRVSLTPQPGESRTQEVVVALEILQALDQAGPGLRVLRLQPIFVSSLSQGA